MKLTIAKRIAYVILGSLVCFVFIFNPVIMDWFSPDFAFESLPLGEIARGPASASPPPPPAQQTVNWWTASVTPGVLYIGKRFVDWFFDNVMPKRSES